MNETMLLPILIFFIAILFSAVGQAGGTGYLAAMAFVGVPPEVMKPTSLSLNVLVASIALVRFARAGWFSWRLFWPFAVASVPLAFLGGRILPPSGVYEPMIGCVLLLAAYRLFSMPDRRGTEAEESRPVSKPLALGLGGVIGLVSGLTGTGGGYFLAPLLLHLRWGEIRDVAGVTSAFILINSGAGLLGHLSSTASLPKSLPIWAVAAVAGGAIGSGLGSRWLKPRTMQSLLALILALAGLKLVLP